jgi:hypothetical protein
VAFHILKRVIDRAEALGLTVVAGISVNPV